jgi:response regulator RpfG family c-di-GMP phosphodiesterase
MSSENPGRVLCLDDEEGILLCMDRQFRRDRFLYLCTMDPTQALEWTKTHRPQVVISDYRMEKANGIDFLASTRSICPGAVRILLSGFADEDRIQQALASGDVTHFVHKPWDPKTFRENLKSWVAASRTTSG